eukprot:TRINITY_DN22529_c0_g1_i1.p4 TRINITY_DN22529_c0_g1~~TRINITY_DN22529_c0_g1_i1.p4  ORF type:complete len:103 (-),score=3.59 TRINITY_DN22529_c0_g1_i1:367-675(-)
MQQIQRTEPDFSKRQIYTNPASTNYNPIDSIQWRQLFWEQYKNTPKQFQTHGNEIFCLQTISETHFFYIMDTIWTSLTTNRAKDHLKCKHTLDQWSIGKFVL